MSVAPQSPSQVREPPKNLNAERTVLGATLIDNATIDIVVDLLRADFFYPTAHQEIYQAVAGLHRENLPVDIVSVAEHLDRHGKLDASGGAAYLAGFEQHVLTTQNIEHYCLLVRDAWQRRELIQASHEIIEDCHRAELDNSELVDLTEKRIQAITDKEARQDFQLMEDVAYEAMDELEKRSADHHDITGVPTGFEHLDDKLSGMQRGDLIILAGRTSVGKTALGLNIAANVALKAKRPVAIFSLEMNAKSLHNRLLSFRSQTPMNFIRSGIRSKDLLLRVNEANEQIAQAPIYIDDTSGLTTNQLRSRARRLQARVPDLSLILVDYLQLMHLTDVGRGPESRQNEVAEMSRSLKILAGELDIPVMALAQVNRNPELRRGPNQRPQLSDLRESGAIEQDADVVIFVHRENRPQGAGVEGPPPDVSDKALPQNAEIIVAKQRNGATGTIPVLFFGAYTLFTTLDKRHWPRSEG